MSISSSQIYWTSQQGPILIFHQAQTAPATGPDSSGYTSPSAQTRYPGYWALFLEVTPLHQHGNYPGYWALFLRLHLSISTNCPGYLGPIPQEVGRPEDASRGETRPTYGQYSNVAAQVRGHPEVVTGLSEKTRENSNTGSAYVDLVDENPDRGIDSALYDYPTVKPLEPTPDGNYINVEKNIRPCYRD
ncbi:hypothetical protein RRG08_048924 [Elysia crispata]|uniref:Uncharacterized protein n=1 Tax=Elysia crispata TaxID=231223 RepID=A0AAE1A6X3_9GAST|nr:hypothetical protein RRG08_048924 [Elysia crispata]